MRAPRHVPLPAPDAVSEGFWSACAEQRLVVQQCSACGAFQSPPRLLCTTCRGADLSWRDSAGSGRVYTYTVAHYAATPALRDQTPYVVVVVELDDCGGALMTSNLVGESAADVRVGMRVQVRWDQDAGMWLPRFALEEQNNDR
jgi:uncharacterized OB-fold protein